MKAKITIGKVEIDISEASVTELFEFAQAANKTAVSQDKLTDVVSVTKEAISARPKQKATRSNVCHPWTETDLLFIARMAVDLGSNADRAGSTIAAAMLKQPSNHRIYTTLYSMANNVFRYLTVGKPGNMSNANIKILNAMGYTPGVMIRTAQSSNMLGDVRHLNVQQA